MPNPDKLNTPTLLSERELEILRLVANENSNLKIAEILGISERTVETHRKHIFKKTKSKTLVGLIKYACKHKIV